MKKTIIVKYKYEDENTEHNDLICELTEFFDKYLLSEYSDSHLSTLWRTYLYNDISFNDTNSFYYIAFRVPGATRGCIYLEKLDTNLYKIKDIYFIEEECFGTYACYKSELKEDSKQYIDKVLDFSQVKLKNNKE